MLIARQSTAVIVTVGPVLDASGVAVTTAVVGDFKISKGGGAPAALNGSATLTHRNTGHYSLSLTTTDTNTVGGLEVVIDKTTDACPVKEIQVVEEAVYDALFAASALGYVANAPVNVAQFGGTNGTFASGRPEVNVSHIGGSTTPVTNMTTVYSTDFASNYNTALDQWAVNVTRIDGSAASGQIRTAVGLASANLDTQLGAIDTTADSILAAIGTPVDVGGGSATVFSNQAYIASTVDSVYGAVTTLDGSTFTVIPWNAAWDAEVQSEVQDAIEANHLDHLLAVTYDPAAKPGAADALLNELIGNDAGVSQFTANALELAPAGGGGGGDATLANQTTIIGHLTDIKGATWSGATDSLEAIRDRGDAAWVTATAVTVTGGTVDTITNTVPAGIVTVFGGDGAYGDSLLALLAANGTGWSGGALATAAAVAALPTAAEVATSVFTTAMTEAYRSAGATATLAQFAYEVLAHLGESSIAGTTKTLKRLDGTTTAKTYTLNDATTPTSITELS